jgi:hypothetical protein
MLIPPEGLPFFVARGKIILEPRAGNHLELLASYLGVNLADDVELDTYLRLQHSWFRREQPRMGRVSLRGGQLDLPYLTKGLTEPSAGSEFAEQERDLGEIQRVAALVKQALRDFV